MRFLDLTLPTLAENLALDEALLLAAETGGPEVLRVWSWPAPAVVLGAGGRLAADVLEAACRADGVPITRRSSGGGTVLLGSGCLLFTLVLAYERHPALAEVLPSYRHILGAVGAALAEFVAGPLAVQGSSDLTRCARKLSGNAQQRKRTHLLHHGTLLHAFDLGLVSRYLTQPPRQPEYRQRRAHLDFLENIPARADQLSAALRRTWEAEEPLVEWPADQVRRLVAEKYALESWIRRR